MNQPATNNDTVWTRLHNQPAFWPWLVILVLIAATTAIVFSNQVPQRPMCQLFDGYQATNSEKHRILVALGNSQLKNYQITNGQILVPNSEKAKFLAALHEQNALPIIFQQQEKASPNLFMPKSQQAMLDQERKKRQIQEMILHLPFVREAWLEMDTADSGNAFQQGERSAVVLVRSSADTALSRQQVQSIQRVVSGGIADLQPQQVVVTDANVGVSYRDLSDQSQAEMIELVNWRVSRRQHYLNRLQHLQQEYPGIEIQIEVTKTNDTPKQNTPEDTIARVPAKFASRELVQQNREPATLTLNGGGSVGTTVASRDRDDVYTDRLVAPASYETSLKPIVPVEIVGSNERVKIQVTVPSATIQSCRLSQESETVSDRFELVKRDIAGKIRTAIPATVLDPVSPISVVQIGCCGNGSKSEEFVDVAKKYWPFAALALLGVAALVINRPSSVVQTSEQVSEETSPEVEEQELQQKLANLIDSNPEAAAQVLKDWIRDGS